MTDLLFHQIWAWPRLTWLQFGKSSSPRNTGRPSLSLLARNPLEPPTPGLDQEQDRRAVVHSLPLPDDSKAVQGRPPAGSLGGRGGCVWPMLWEGGLTHPVGVTGNRHEGYCHSVGTRGGVARIRFRCTGSPTRGWLIRFERKRRRPPYDRFTSFVPRQGTAFADGARVSLDRRSRASPSCRGNIPNKPRYKFQIPVDSEDRSPS